MGDKPARGLFITGTDTGVGKTYVGVLIARSLRAAGFRVGVYKPAASGCRRDGQRLVSDDAVALWEAAGRPCTLDEVCPQRFEAPLAPHLAARAEGRQLDAALLRSGLDVWRRQSDVVLVEGAGGLMSPLGDCIVTGWGERLMTPLPSRERPGEGQTEQGAGPSPNPSLTGRGVEKSRTLTGRGVQTRLRDDDYNATLCEEFGLPLLVVARNALGTINHTLQTLIAAAAFGDGLSVAGIVLNHPHAPSDDASLTTNRRELAARAVAPVLAEVARGADRFDIDVDWYALAAQL